MGKIQNSIEYVEVAHDWLWRVGTDCEQERKGKGKRLPKAIRIKHVKAAIANLQLALKELA